MRLEEINYNSINLKCGYVTYMLLRTPSGFKVYSRENYCMSWDCEECRPRLNRQWILAIVKAFNERNGPHIFVGYISFTQKELTEFIDENIDRGTSYLKIYVRGGAYLIATRSFPGSRRRHKDRFIKEDLENILNEPWERIGREHRISSSRGFVTLPKKEPKNLCVATLNRHQFHEIDGTNLDEDEGIEYLRNKVDRKNLTKLGRKIIQDIYPEKPSGANLIKEQKGINGINAGGLYANPQ